MTKIKKKKEFLFWNYYYVGVWWHIITVIIIYGRVPSIRIMNKTSLLYQTTIIATISAIITILRTNAIT